MSLSTASITDIFLSTLFSCFLQSQFSLILSFLVFIYQIFSFSNRLFVFTIAFQKFFLSGSFSRPSINKYLFFILRVFIFSRGVINIKRILLLKSSATEV